MGTTFGKSVNHDLQVYPHNAMSGLYLLPGPLRINFNDGNKFVILCV